MLVKTAVPTLTFIAIILLSLAAPNLLVNSANANFFGEFPDPTPEITVQSPKNRTTYFQDQITLNITTTVPFESDITITYQLDHQATVYMARSKIDGTEYSTILNSLSEGYHTVNVFAYGENLQGKSGMETASVTFLVDVVPPSVSVISPKNGTYTTYDLPLNFTLSEMAKWIGYSLDEQQLVSIAGNTTLIGLSEGPHSLTVYANDTVGRKGNSETIYFNIGQKPDEAVAKQPEPPNALIPTASAVSVAAVGLGLLLYSNKRKHKVAQS